MARLRPDVEAAALIRRVESDGGFGMVLRKGDPDQGAVLLVVTSRGRHVAFLERVLSPSGNYVWEAAGPGDSAKPEEVAQFLARRARFDADSWLIELDIAEPERFIAETTHLG